MPEADERDETPGPSSAPDVRIPSDDGEEIEPELIELAVDKPFKRSNNPPPPPSLRPGGGALAVDQSGPGPRFQFSTTPRLVKDLMTRKLFTIEPDARLEHLEEHMEAFAIRHLPVVAGKKLVGLITRSDLLHASSSFLSDHAHERDVLIHKVPARRIMQTELITVKPNEALDEVIVLMWEAKLGCVLVTNDDEELVGILTQADFLRLAHHCLTQGA